jgi:hypothetical protein
VNETPEVAAAAERREIYKADPEAETWNSGGLKFGFATVCADSEILANAYLALRARDEAPIDEAWLRKQLGSPSNESSTVHDWRIGMRTGVISGGYSMVVSCDKSRRLPWRYSVCVVIDGFRRELVYPTTRQQLLNLIAALGGEGRK